MSDLWKEDPEAFIILRLQESSDPDSAHRAFQHVLAEVERLRAENMASEELFIETHIRLQRRDEEVARLRRIEEAAKTVLLEADDGHDCIEGDLRFPLVRVGIVDALRAALEK